MRRRRDAIVLAASLLAHIALLVAWISTRPSLNLVEPPTMEVQLVRPPPRSRPEPPTPSPPKTKREPRPLVVHQPAPTESPAPAPLPIAPEWQVRPEGPSAGDLAAAPFAAGRRAQRPSCKTRSWDRPVDCPPDAAELAASRSDAASDAKTAGFEAAGRYKRAVKTYHELPGDAGYPGIACAIFRKC
ncbi:hypothetical protein [Phenylobacterium sp.]|uniref:hypothetical protein n=1 Tax=Phenylobacterium sp. TaxID=1871053 RepID=UPI002E2F59C4|nr:hypothetical protein [Phenylobacterium sp.]HEX4712487.1 hypothetical protein [Phenylobacterium sp.]